MGAALNHTADLINNLRSRLEDFQSLGAAEEAILAEEALLSKRKLAALEELIPALIQRITRQQETFAGSVEEVLGEVRFPEAVAAASTRSLGFFEDLVAWSREGGGSPDGGAEAAREVDRLQSNYTMASERAVHAAAAQPASGPAVELFGEAEAVPSAAGPPEAQPPPVPAGEADPSAVSQAGPAGRRSAGWETRETADLEVCGTKNPPTTSGGTPGQGLGDAATVPMTAKLYTAKPPHDSSARRNRRPCLPMVLVRLGGVARMATVCGLGNPRDSRLGSLRHKESAHNSGRCRTGGGSVAGEWALRLRLALQAGGSGAFEHNLGDDCLWASRSSAGFSACRSSPPSRGRSGPGGIHPEDRSLVHDGIQRMLSCHSPPMIWNTGCVIRMERWDGGRVMALPMVVNGTVERVHGVAQDITERKQRECELRQFSCRSGKARRPWSSLISRAGLNTSTRSFRGDRVQFCGGAREDPGC